MTDSEQLEVNKNVSAMLARRCLFLENEVNEAKQRIDAALADNNEAALPQLRAAHYSLVTSWRDAGRMLAPETNVSH